MMTKLKASLASLLVTLLPSAGCDASVAAARPVATPEPVVDAPLAAFQGKLLDLAFEVASDLPVDPHVKERSRAQEAVAAACLELDQPLRALHCVEGIENWRRGAGYADYAFYLVQERGDSAEVREFLERAMRVAEEAQAEGEQAWRVDRIRTKVARTHVWLRREDEAARLADGAEASELASVRLAEARFVDPGDADRFVERLDEVDAKASFEAARSALRVCAQFFDRFYDDEVRRARVEAGIRATWNHLPAAARMDLMIELAEFAVDHGDSAKANQLLGEATKLLEGEEWTPDFGIRARAALSGLRHEAGESETARRDADASLGLYEAEREKIMGIERAAVLRTVAEVYAEIDATSTALAIYTRAVEEGAANPNARPRCLDLSATCVSMALHAVEPDEALLERMARIDGDLREPW